MTGNPAFPTLTVPLLDVSALQTTFHNALAAAANGGTQLTAVKNQARIPLLDALDKNAMYVQAIARYDLAMLLSSGYQAASTNRAQSQLATPSIMDIENELSTQLVVRLSPIPNAYAYEAQAKNGTGGFVPAGTFTQARRIILTGLTPGQTYTVQIRAVGGSTGYSDWSDPLSHMAM
ncbi:MAG: fibronectin type III domain-containing protein [Limisphaerales bacterium]